MEQAHQRNTGAQYSHENASIRTDTARRKSKGERRTECNHAYSRSENHRACVNGYTALHGRIAFVRTASPPLNFSEALIGIKNGHKLARSGWNGSGMYIMAQFPDENSKNNVPYIYMICPIGSTKQFGGISNIEEKRIPWLCSQTDMFADDWIML